MGWEKQKGKWPWRQFLTAEERSILEKVDEAKQKWLKLNRVRAGIANRALQRAKAASGKESQK